MKTFAARLALVLILASAGPIAAPAQTGQTLDQPLTTRQNYVENIVNYPFGAQKPMSLEQYSEIVRRAGARRGWSIALVRPGMLVGTLNIRSHQVVVDIVHDTSMYSITYKSSVNMQYNAARNAIHRNYNAWVRNLRDDIQREVSMQ